MDAETGFTDYDVERFGQDFGTTPEYLDVVKNPRPNLIEPKDLLPNPSAINRTDREGNVLIFNKNRKVASTMLTKVIMLLGKLHKFW